MKESSPQPLNAALKKHYTRQSLSAEQSDHLLAMQAEGLQQEAKAGTKPGKQGLFGHLGQYIPPAFANYRYAFHITAAMLVLSLVVIFSLMNQPPLAQKIMSEIVYNHQQKMPVEVASASLDDIRQYLDKLTFPIISPQSLTQPDWQLLGGRYCAINGKLAAQLKVKNLADNNVYTLYQAAIDDQLKQVVGAAQTTTVIDGVDVAIWQEKGLLLGLASSP